MVSAPYARKNGGKTKNCRSCRQGLYLEINFADRVDGHIIIYIFASASVRLRLCFCVCVRASASESMLLRVRPPVCVSVRASACPSVLLRARPCFCVPVRASACPSVLLRVLPPIVCPSVRLQVGTLNIRASSAWVEKSSRHVLRLDERTRTFEVYYNYIGIFRAKCYAVNVST